MQSASEPSDGFRTSRDGLGPAKPDLSRRESAAGRRGWAIVVVAAVALAIRLAIAWAPLEWLLRTVLGDDPFYYFTIARNLGHGLGPSFDAAAPTNGFHPLWLLVVTPIFGAVPDPERAIHLALSVSAVADVAALVLLHRLLRALDVRAGAAAAVAALYALSPLVLSTSGPLNGLETALNLALGFAFLAVYVRAFAPDGAPAPGLALRLGLWSGLLFLTRTDNGVPLAICHAALLWRARGDPPRQRVALAAPAVAALLAAPWLTWSILTFGSPVQVSGLAAAHVTRALARAAGVHLFVQVGRNLATFVTYFPVHRVNNGSFATAAAANLSLLLGLGVAVARRWRADGPDPRASLRRRVAPLVPALAGSAALVLVHTLRAVELRGWYYTSLLPPAYALLGIAVDYATSAPFPAAGLARRARTAAALAFAGLAAAAIALSARAALARACGEDDGYRMIRAVNDLLPDGTPVGAWNAGLYGYFYRRGRIVDLDGLVDNRAYDHLVHRDLGAYAAERRIRYLLDAPGAMAIARPYWSADGAVSFGASVLDNRGRARCRELGLVAVPDAP